MNPSPRAAVGATEQPSMAKESQLRGRRDEGAPSTAPLGVGSAGGFGWHWGAQGGCSSGVRLEGSHRLLTRAWQRPSAPGTAGNDERAKKNQLVEGYLLKSSVAARAPFPVP